MKNIKGRIVWKKIYCFGRKYGGVKKRNKWFKNKFEEKWVRMWNVRSRKYLIWIWISNIKWYLCKINECKRKWDNKIWEWFFGKYRKWIRM